MLEETTDYLSIAIADIKPASGAAPAAPAAAPSDRLPVREVWVRPSADGSPPYDVLNPPPGVVFKADPSDFPMPAAAPAVSPEQAATRIPREIVVQPGPDGSMPQLVGLPPDVAVKVAPVAPPSAKPATSATTPRG